MGALLWHGDFYKVAAADCGCHDNRMDKIWWNEQWMDYPIGPHYAQQSNTVNAHRLKGNLLLTVGELDTNVDPSSIHMSVVLSGGIVPDDAVPAFQHILKKVLVSPLIAASVPTVYPSLPKAVKDCVSAYSAAVEFE